MNSDLEYRIVEDDPLKPTNVAPEEQKVEYVLDDDGKKTTYDATGGVALDNFRKAAHALAQLRLLQKRAGRSRIKARELKARVAKRRKADKAAKAARKRNRKKK